MVAVDGLDLEVMRGECFGLLGPNGAGKTTTIEICEGLTSPDDGTVEMLGLNWASGANELRQRIGIQLQETQFPDKLTVEETLRLFRSFFRRGISVEESIRTAQLEEKRRSRVGTLSGGQKQRLALARGILAAKTSDIILLDEPTSSVDPKTEIQIYEKLFEECKGKAVVSSLHRLYLLSYFDYVYVLRNGHIIDEGTFTELKLRSPAFQELWKHQEEKEGHSSSIPPAL